MRFFSHRPLGGVRTGLTRSYGLKIAPTVSLLLILMLHCSGFPATGVQFADQPPNTEPEPGVAVSTTVMFSWKLPVQLAPAADDPHKMVPGELATVPVPVPAS